MSLVTEAHNMCVYCNGVDSSGTFDPVSIVAVDGMGTVERIRSVRIAEGMSQEAFAKEIGMTYSSLRQYETGRRASIGSQQLEKITNHPRFEKYALWLVTGKTAPEAGQISPDIEVERNTG